jgi:hypothetical protein
MDVSSVETYLKEEISCHESRKISTSVMMWKLEVHSPRIP